MLWKNWCVPCLFLCLSFLRLGPVVSQRNGHSPCRVHAFYYLWYGNPETDGSYLHWNHEVLPHWKKKINLKYQTIIGRRFEPPGDIHAPFYPSRGPYSSSDPKVLDGHMQEMKQAGICVAVLSWWGQADRKGTSDTQGVQTDKIIHLAVRAAERNGMKISFHLEPYQGRNASTVLEDTHYLMHRFGRSKALHRASDSRPVFYIYDSYHVPSVEWKYVFDGIRGTNDDKIFVALWLNADGGQLAKEGGFDGVYTYFSSQGFTHGSSPSNWKRMSEYCQSNHLLWIPSVGPGYDDHGIRPWNFHNTKQRDRGKYYDNMWKEAIASQPSAVSITSYNEWGEGTQIEPAVPKRAAHTVVKDPTLLADDFRVYKDYEEEGSPKYYLDRTRHHANKFRLKLKQAADKVPILKKAEMRAKLEL